MGGGEGMTKVILRGTGADHREGRREAVPGRIIPAGRD